MVRATSTPEVILRVKSTPQVINRVRSIPQVIHPSGIPVVPTASGSGMGQGGALATVTHPAVAAGSGAGVGAATALVTHPATAAGSGLGAGTATALVSHFATAAGSGTGAGTASATVTTEEFDPIADIGWHSAFWAEGAEFAALGLADTDPVSTWPDEIGGFDVSNADTARPLYSASYADFGGQPAVVFDGSNDVLLGSDFPSAVTQTWSLVVVADDDGTGLRTPWSSTENQVFIRCGDSGGYRIKWNTNTTAGTRVAGPHLFTGVAAGASSLLELDGTTVVSGNAGVSSCTKHVIGSNGVSAQQPFQGGIAFVGLFSGDVRSDGSWADFEAWVEDHYGLTVA